AIWTVIGERIAPTAEPLLGSLDSQRIELLPQGFKEVGGVRAVVAGQKHNEIGTVQARQLGLRPTRFRMLNQGFAHTITDAAQPAVGFLTIMRGIDGREVSLPEDQHMAIARGLRRLVTLFPSERPAQLINEIPAICHTSDIIRMQGNFQGLDLTILLVGSG